MTTQTKAIAIGLVVVLLGVFAVSKWSAKKEQNYVPSPSPVVGTVTSPYDEQPISCHNGTCSYFYSGDCADATTTLVRIPTPNGATSTVDFLELNVWQSGTSSIGIYSATTSQGAGYALPTQPTATSTGLIIGYYMPNATTSAVIVNNNDNSDIGGVVAGSVTASKSRISLNSFALGVANSTYPDGRIATSSPGAYLTVSAFANSGGAPAGVINPTNTFKCSYNARFLQPRRTIGQ